MSKPFSLKAVLTANELGRILKWQDVPDRTCFLNVGRQSGSVPEIDDETARGKGKGRY